MCHDKFKSKIDTAEEKSCKGMDEEATEMAEDVAWCRKETHANNFSEIIIFIVARVLL